jgi:CheY-like chemotaxis protein
MNEPLALIAYERVLPGGQLVNRLQDLRYRVQTLPGPETLAETAEREKPMLVIADLGTKASEMCDAIRQVKQCQATSHIPVIAIIAVSNASAEKAARDSGADLVVTDSAIQIHFKQLLDQALHLE